MACVSVLTALIFISCFKPRYLRLEAEQGYAAEQILGFGQSERGQIPEEQLNTEATRQPPDGQETVVKVN